METDKLLHEIYNIVKNPNLQPDLAYFEKYGLSEDSLARIDDINKTVTNQYNTIQLLQTPLGEKQLKNQLAQVEKMTQSGEQTFEVIHDLKESLKHTLKESENSQNITKIMYVLSFVLGLALIVVAVLFAIQGKTILAIAFGTFGMADIVAHFIADPPARLQESRSNYVQLTALTLAWFKETINNDGCIAASGQMTPEMIKNYNSLAENYVNNTERFFKMVDDLAEPKPKRRAGKQPKENEG
ncbi:hypothetical protein [Marixanthomonas spongiae]|uniref:Uncharacterized protein n=1 Tax=Marixanthomonas spongiae TaxID=2174845 RepID=A0A2U0I553_9FLAO|nr:hypothetical protein [Marixanthomonas spongiae]PVW16235.1 hypothetical protein DDV96_02905 [Marixanthomonas spongiae]